MSKESFLLNYHTEDLVRFRTRKVSWKRKGSSVVIGIDADRDMSGMEVQKAANAAFTFIAIDDSVVCSIVNSKISHLSSFEGSIYRLVFALKYNALKYNEVERPVSG